MEHQVVLFANSANNSYISPAKDQFTVDFEQAVYIPQEVKNVTIEVVNASMWNSFHNIETDVNDQLWIEFNNGADQYNITIPPGIYDLEALNDTIQRQLPPAFRNKVIFSGDKATQKVVIYLKDIGSKVIFNVPNSAGTICGFGDSDAPAIGRTSVVNTYVVAPNVAQFGAVTNIVIHSDIITNGIISSNMKQVLAQIPINVDVGALMVYEPINPIKIECNHLLNNYLYNARFWITDQNNNPLNTNGENWNLMMVIRYYK
jgi:hypothetical protein